MKMNEIGIFQCLSVQDQEEIQAQLHCKNFKQGQLILGDNIDSDYIYFVLKGQLKESTFTRSGKEIIFNILAEGDSFGLLTAINGAPTITNYIAKTDCELCAMSSKNFRRVMKLHESIINSVMAEFTATIQKLSMRLYEFRALDVSQRTRAELLRHAVPEHEGHGASINLLPTHEEIANTVFSHREAITKELCLLRKLGIIKRSNGQLIIPDTRALERLIPEYVM